MKHRLWDQANESTRRYKLNMYQTPHTLPLPLLLVWMGYAKAMLCLVTILYLHRSQIAWMISKTSYKLSWIFRSRMKTSWMLLTIATAQDGSRNPIATAIWGTTVSRLGGCIWASLKNLNHRSRNRLTNSIQLVIRDPQVCSSYSLSSCGGCCSSIQQHLDHFSLFSPHLDGRKSYHTESPKTVEHMMTCLSATAGVLISSPFEFPAARVSKSTPSPSWGLAEH